MSSNQDRTAIIVIPALNPPNELYNVVHDIRQKSSRRVLIFNDGSDPQYNDLFSRVRTEFSDIIYLEHSVNCGKGKTLKDSISYAMEHYPGCGIVTADSDGQHLAADILKIAEVLEEDKTDLVLGFRDFSDPNVPARSKFGNRITCLFFRYFLNLHISDTQTGLRGVSPKIMPALLQIPGDRYEFETEMLLEIKRKNFSLIQQKISTVYINSNRESHFNPIKDSFSIYSRLLKCVAAYFSAFICSSLISAVIDIGIYSLLFFLLSPGIPGRLFISVAAARIISSICNYLINKNFVFADAQNSESYYDHRSFFQYSSLVILIMMLSYLFTKLGIYLFSSISPVVIKLVVDTGLFLLSFTIQRAKIFADLSKVEKKGRRE